jgi:3',5'-cyclic-AMP phosphodiesterase
MAAGRSGIRRYAGRINDAMTTFSFIQITDHHLRESESLLTHGYSTVRAFQAVLRHIADHTAGRADFIVTTGDLVESGTDAEYQAVCGMLNLEVVSGAPGPHFISIEGLRSFPMYFLPGNHDPRAVFFRNLFPLTPPADLMNVAFEHQGVRFICLDWGPQGKAVVHRETLDFLADALPTDRPSVLLMHHHVVPVGSRWLDNLIADDVDRFWESVCGSSVIGIFCGHTHATYEAEVAGIPIFGLRSTTFQFALQDELLFCLRPPHYRLVTIRDGRLTTEIFEVPL